MFFSVRAFIVSLILALVTPLVMAPLVGVGIAEHYLVYFAVTLVTVYLGTVLCNGTTTTTTNGNEAPTASQASAKTTQSQQQDSDHDSDEDDDRELGTVKWFNSSKGFGFLTMDSGDDVFVHYRAIRGRGRRFLIEGQKVRFHVTEGEKGKQAENVSIVK